MDRCRGRGPEDGRRAGGVTYLVTVQGARCQGPRCPGFCLRVPSIAGLLAGPILIKILFILGCRVFHRVAPLGCLKRTLTRRVKWTARGLL